MRGDHMRDSFILIMTAFLALSFACSNGNKPSKKELEISFINHLPAY